MANYFPRGTANEWVTNDTEVKEDGLVISHEGK